MICGADSQLAFGRALLLILIDFEHISWFLLEQRSRVGMYAYVNVYVRIHCSLCVSARVLCFGLFLLICMNLGSI